MNNEQFLIIPNHPANVWGRSPLRSAYGAWVLKKRIEQIDELCFLRTISRWPDNDRKDKDD